MARCELIVAKVAKAICLALGHLGGCKSATLGREGPTAACGSGAAVEPAIVWEAFVVLEKELDGLKDERGWRRDSS